MKWNSNGHTFWVKIMTITLSQLSVVLLLTGIAFAKEGKAQETLNQSITLQSKNSELQTVLQQLEKIGKVRFVYSPRVIPVNYRVSVNAKAEKLAVVLDNLLMPLHISYEMVGGQIVLKKESSDDSSLLTDPLAEQNPTAQVVQTVKGRVTTEEGEGLPGVSVVLKGTTTGTATDAKGDYSLSLPDGNGILVFSFIGYTTEEVAINNRTTLDVNLLLDIKSLSEVVVVGYGTLTKRDLSGSIVKLAGDELRYAPTTSFEQAIQGKAAGVQIVQGSGMAGSGSVVRIRGVASVSAGGDPLYVVDGIPITQDPFLNGNRGGMNNNPLATLNPNDIESVEILKDAGAAGIYGSRGANGVILITTKRGKSGKPVFNFSTRVGISEPTIKQKFVNGNEWLQLRQEAFENDGGVGPAPLPKSLSWEDAKKTNTDWYDLTTRTGIKSEYNLSMSQGGKKLKSYVGASYSDNQSYLKGNSYQRLNGRVNLDYAITSRLKASLSSSLSRGQNNRVAAAWNGGLGAAMSEALPIYPVNLSNGEFYKDGNNPVRQQELTNIRTVEVRTVNSLAFDYQPIDNLTIKITGGLDYMDLVDDKYEPKAFTNSDHAGEAHQYPSWVTNYNTNATASYNYQTNKDNRFTFLLGAEYQRSLTIQYSDIKETDVFGPRYKNPERGPKYERLDTRAANQAWSFLSYFARVNYTLKDRYVFQALARVDASSRFGSNYRYGFFPTASAAWIISEEDFLKNSKVISLLKVKSSYGITGNSNIPNYERFGTYSPQTNSNPYNGQPTIFPLRLDNPNLKWETLTTVDVSVEVGLISALMDKTSLCHLDYGRCFGRSRLAARPHWSGIGVLQQTFQGYTN